MRLRSLRCCNRDSRRSYGAASIVRDGNSRSRVGGFHGERRKSRAGGAVMRLRSFAAAVTTRVALTVQLDRTDGIHAAGGFRGERRKSRTAALSCACVRSPLQSRLCVAPTRTSSPLFAWALTPVARGVSTKRQISVEEIRPCGSLSSRRRRCSVWPRRSIFGHCGGSHTWRRNTPVGHRQSRGARLRCTWRD